MTDEQKKDAIEELRALYKERSGISHETSMFSYVRWLENQAVKLKDQIRIETNWLKSYRDAYIKEVNTRILIKDIFHLFVH